MKTLNSIPLLLGIFLSFSLYANDENTQNISTQSPIISSNHNWDVSGYVKVIADHPEDADKVKLEIDDLSIYVSSHINRWINPFVEAEYFGKTLWSKQSSNKNKGKFIFERLYNDTNVNNTDRIRVGKFLAPIGYWNLIHAAPLVWTVNRPLTSTYSYSNYITGVEYGHSINAFDGSRIDSYIQLSNEFNAKPLTEHPRRYSKVVGLSWTLSDNLDTRSSLDFQYAKVKENNSKRTTFSFHKVWYLEQFDIDTQLIYTKVQADNQTISNDNILVIDGWDGGGYLQARYRFSHQLNFYGRTEYFHISQRKDAGQNLILGARYKMSTLGNINIELKTGTGVKEMNDDGMTISYNAMFR
jgi:hypothetical protein